MMFFMIYISKEEIVIGKLNKFLKKILISFYIPSSRNFYHDKKSNLSTFLCTHDKISSEKTSDFLISRTRSRIRENLKFIMGYL
jgi:hypothetical protein